MKCLLMRQLRHESDMATKFVKFVVLLPIIHKVLRSPGQPLDSATLAFMEPCFGYESNKTSVYINTIAALTQA